MDGATNPHYVLSLKLKRLRHIRTVSTHKTLALIERVSVSPCLHKPRLTEALHIYGRFCCHFLWETPFSQQGTFINSTFCCAVLEPFGLSSQFNSFCQRREALMLEPCAIEGASGMSKQKKDKVKNTNLTTEQLTRGAPRTQIPPCLYQLCFSWWTGTVLPLFTLLKYLLVWVHEAHEGY